MTDIGPHLERLGLGQYHDALVAEGFDTWETLLDIQESDLDTLGFKLGHRRKLQRGIAEFRGFSSDRPLGSPPQEGSVEGTRASESGIQSVSGKDTPSTQAPEQKRKYRRHPKPDENAPEKPPSAYVIFSNKVREEVKGDNLSFTEIARLVGERWQKLEPDEKEPFESQAATQKENYLTQLTEYKKTDAYRDYLQYLADFKAKHGQATESKRPKLDLQQSSSSTSGFGLETEVTPQGPRHNRGGSLGSISTASQSAALPSPAGVSLAPVSSLPNLNIVTSHQHGFGARGTSPTHYSREIRFPGHLSSQSSVSEDSGVTRPDQLDPLSRTATLSLSTPPAMTPPLPSSTSMGGRSDHGNPSEAVAWTHRHAPSQHYGSALTASPSGRTSTPTTYPPTSEVWRERSSETNRPSFQSSYQPSHTQPSSVPISQLLGSDHGAELTHAQAQRTLPPLRRLPSVPSASPTGMQPYTNASHATHSGSADEGQSQSRRQAGRSENEAAAASVLAGLSQRQRAPKERSDGSEHRPLRRR